MTASEFIISIRNPQGSRNPNSVESRDDKFYFIILVSKRLALHQPVDVAIADDLVRAISSLSKKKREVAAVDDRNLVARKCPVDNPAVSLFL